VDLTLRRGPWPTRKVFRGSWCRCEMTRGSKGIEECPELSLASGEEDRGLTCGLVKVKAIEDPTVKVLVVQPSNWHDRNRLPHY